MLITQYIVNVKKNSLFYDEIVSRQLADLHDRFVIVPADKASNNVVFICKTYYYSCLQKELIDNNDVDSLLILLCTGFLNYTRIHTNNVS